MRALPVAIVRALRNTGVGRGGITNRCGALKADPSLVGKGPQRPARSFRTWDGALLEISVAT